MEKTILKSMIYKLPETFLQESEQTKKISEEFFSKLKVIAKDDFEIFDSFETSFILYGNCRFEEGFIIALKTMKAYRNLLDEPEKYFKEMLEG